MKLNHDTKPVCENTVLRYAKCVADYSGSILEDSEFHHPAVHLPTPADPGHLFPV